jgi:hypothetical protein
MKRSDYENVIETARSPVRRRPEFRDTGTRDDCRPISAESAENPEKISLSEQEKRRFPARDKPREGKIFPHA